MFCVFFCVKEYFFTTVSFFNIHKAGQAFYIVSEFGKLYFWNYYSNQDIENLLSYN